MARRRDSRGAAAQEYRRWYWTARWRHRAKAQLEAEPLCAMCMARGLVVVATVADHVEPHRGDPDLFWAGPLQSLCASCHSSDKQREERGGRPRPVIGLDGWPVE